MKFWRELIVTGLFSFIFLTPFSAKANSGDTCLLTCEEVLAFSIVTQSKEYLGASYRSGGCNPDGFDCSGFVNFLFKNHKIPIQRSSSAIASSIAGDPVTLDEAKPGDLLFFNGRYAGTTKVGHVAMVSSNKDGVLLMVHSTNGLGVIEENLYKSKYFMTRFLYAIRPDWKRWVNK